MKKNSTEEKDPYALTPEEKDKTLIRIKDFFVKVAEYPDKYPVTLPTIAEFMDWNVRWMQEYPASGPLFKVIERLKVKCENYLVSRMLDKKVDSKSAMLMLKSLHGYKDTKELTIKRRVSISDILDDIEKD